MERIIRPEIEKESMVVIYDPRTGRVVHRHEVVTTKGAVHPDSRTQESDALKLLGQMQPTFKAKVAVLHVDPRTVKVGSLYKVDPKKRVLVELKRRKR